jgi:hypothetical protein
MIRKWEVAYAAYGGNETIILEQGGWEPFAVTIEPTDSGPVRLVWYRRRVWKT